MSKIDRTFFYDTYRINFSKLNQSQVDGINILFDYQDIVNFPINQLAYILATTYHETRQTFEPVKEAYWIKPESVRVAVLRRYYRKKGTIVYNDGRLFAGEGYIQLTHDYNYKKAGELVGEDLIKNPELALVPEIAVKILFEGMATGLFTTKKLSDYINNNKTDFENARRIVNGLDRAELIGGYANKFLSCLKYSE